MHRANPVCASCHRSMDPLGFTLENFDAVGAWRTRDAGTSRQRIGAVRGRDRRWTASQGFAQRCCKRPEVFVRTLTEKLMTYALGRGLQYYDMPVVRAIVRDAAKQDYRFSSIVLGIVQSAPFQMRMSGAAP